MGFSGAEPSGPYESSALLSWYCVVVMLWSGESVGCAGLTGGVRVLRWMTKRSLWNVTHAFVRFRAHLVVPYGSES